MHGAARVPRPLVLNEPALDEGLRLGVAVAAAPVADGEVGSEAAGGEGRAVVRAERQLARLDAVHGRGFGSRYNAWRLTKATRATAAAG